MAIRERTREVGIMKTLGFAPGALVALTVAESAALAICGGTIGLGLAELTCVLVRHSGTAYAGLDLQITPEIALASIAAATALGVFSSLVPAWQAARMNILHALQHTG